ncbi:diguanylate cyclase [Vibrio chagasii]|nr:diguanylate cyclase [Vibrio chagasii]
MVNCFGRLGGEEFVIMLTDTNLQRYESVLKSCTTPYQSTYLLIRVKKPLNVTASFAYLANPQTHCDFDDLYSVLDQALYQAKSNGFETASSMPK